MATTDLPTEQWAQVIETVGGPPIYKRIPLPTPSPTQVLIHILFSGVCHTDLHAMRHDWPLATKPLPLVGGHEGAGVVVALGSLVPTISPDLHPGSPVGVKWLNGSCLSCGFCTAGDEPLCADAKLSGYTVDGTFQEYVVAEAAHVARLPAGVEGDLAGVAPVLCAGITVYKGLKESGARPGQTVAVVGAAGGLGCMAVQFARAMGLVVVAVDGARGEEEGERKRRSCLELGAAEYVDFVKAGARLVEEVRGATGDGQGPHAVLLLAVQERPFQQATQYVRGRGTVVCIGLPADAELKAPVFDTVVRMITIKGSYVGNRADTAEALDFYRRGLIKVPTTTVGLSELGEVYKMMEEGRIVGRYVVDTSR